MNEAATSGGQIPGGTRVALSQSRLRSDAALVLPLSGVTRSFDGDGRCVDCQERTCHPIRCSAVLQPRVENN